MSLAIVSRIAHIEPHPNADRLEIIFIKVPPGLQQLVTGKHYRSGDLGVWLKPGALIPGWLAHDLWLVGKNRSDQPFIVREIEIRGIASPGLWAGQWYRNDSTKESKLRADELSRGGGETRDGWISWARWNRSWIPGQSVDTELDVRPCPPSSTAEQLASNQQDAAKTTSTDAVEASGSTPAVGST